MNPKYPFNLLFCTFWFSIGYSQSISRILKNPTLDLIETLNQRSKSQAMLTFADSMRQMDEFSAWPRLDRSTAYWRFSWESKSNFSLCWQPMFSSQGYLKTFAIYNGWYPSWEFLKSVLSEARSMKTRFKMVPWLELGTWQLLFCHHGEIQLKKWRFGD